MNRNIFLKENLRHENMEIALLIVGMVFICSVFYFVKEHEFGLSSLCRVSSPHSFNKVRWDVLL